MFGFQTLYGHLNEIDVSVGEKVGKGKVIAKAGNTGNQQDLLTCELNMKVFRLIPRIL